jgi:hypothetical protein
MPVSLNFKVNFAEKRLVNPENVKVLLRKLAFTEGDEYTGTVSFVDSAYSIIQSTYVAVADATNSEALASSNQLGNEYALSLKGSDIRNYLYNSPSKKALLHIECRVSDVVFAFVDVPIDLAANASHNQEAGTITLTDVVGLTSALASKEDKAAGKQLSTEDYTTGEKQKLASIDISTKVDKVVGKGLSTEDYTSAEKSKLANLDNTKDKDKPISDAAQTALNAKADLVNGYLDQGQIPSLLIENIYVKDSEAGMLAIATQHVGDVCVRSDTSTSYILKALPASTLLNWVMLSSPPSAVLTVAGKVGAVVLSKADVGLGDADNTPDSAKPISAPQQTALDGKADVSALAAKADLVHTHTPAAIEYEGVSIAGSAGTNGANYYFIQDAVTTYDATVNAYTSVNRHPALGIGKNYLLSNAYWFIYEKLNPANVFYRSTNFPAFSNVPVWDQSLEWYCISGNAPAPTSVTRVKVYIDAVLSAKLFDKVDKVSGKQLSTEDYSTAEKNKLANLSKTDVGLGNVDNTPDSVKIVAQAGCAGSATAGSMLAAQVALIDGKQPADVYMYRSSVYGSNIVGQIDGGRSIYYEVQPVHSNATLHLSRKTLNGVGEGAQIGDKISIKCDILSAGKTVIIDVEGTTSGSYNGTFTTLATLTASGQKQDFIYSNSGWIVNAAAVHIHSISDVTGLQPALDAKVDVVSGKQLSTEDYTTAEKTKLAGLTNGGGGGTVTFGNTAGTACEGNDARLSDARTPTAHTHSSDDVLFDIGGGQHQTLTGKMSSKVDIIINKGLSTNDFTNAEKAKLDGIDLTTKLDVTQVTNQAVYGNSQTLDYPLAAARDTKYKINVNGNNNIITLTLPRSTDGALSGDTMRVYNTCPADCPLTIRQYQWTGSAYISTYANIVTAAYGSTTYLYFDANLHMWQMERQVALTSDDLTASLATKVTAVAGKGLSTEDYTTAEKNKLAGLSSGGLTLADLENLRYYTTL